MRKKLVMAVLTAVAAAVTVFVGQQVYSAGYNAGLDEGHAGWYDKGYSEGSEDGYDRGFAEGVSAAKADLSTENLSETAVEHEENDLEHGEESLEHGAESAEHGDSDNRSFRAGPLKRRENPPDERYSGTTSLAPRIYEGGGPRSGRGSSPAAAAGKASSVTASPCQLPQRGSQGSCAPFLPPAFMRGEGHAVAGGVLRRSGKALSVTLRVPALPEGEPGKVPVHKLGRKSS